MNNSFPFLECQQLQCVHRVTQPCACRPHGPWGMTSCIPRFSLSLPHLEVVLCCFFTSRTKAIPMSKETAVSLISGLPSLTAQLDGLHADQDPADLSKALISAFTEREGYKMHLAFLAEDETRSKALLEVFDKVCSDRMCNFVKNFSALPYCAGPCGPEP